ncbi:hypothetical protein JOB18_000432 [Solea senegalensis]|uniref:Uncharacterized protein n=1 Tax=Solea senegalensis TaxID=28829 RepID=A0AAV6PR37_SOLSE|nr:hypothetical protein JOB18_000432 [Solea senegalensis]
MTLNDRRELPTEHKDREEQTNEISRHNHVHHFARASSSPDSIRRSNKKDEAAVPPK